jgi:hypothetical protein
MGQILLFPPSLSTAADNEPVRYLYCYRPLLMNNRFKIGIADDVQDRLRRHKTAMPGPIKLIGTRRGIEAEEKQLKAECEVDRIPGGGIEWFEGTPHFKSVVAMTLHRIKWFHIASHIMNCLAEEIEAHNHRRQRDVSSWDNPEEITDEERIMTDALRVVYMRRLARRLADLIYKVFGETIIDPENTLVDVLAYIPLPIGYPDVTHERSDAELPEWSFRVSDEEQAEFCPSNVTMIMDRYGCLRIEQAHEDAS